jgi:hypothetical protein
MSGWQRSRVHCAVNFQICQQNSVTLGRNSGDFQKSTTKLAFSDF